jgi:hypothetical protein
VMQSEYTKSKRESNSCVSSSDATTKTPEQSLEHL